MTDKHSELEKKFAADHVGPARFRTWCMTQGPERFASSRYPDVYYRRGDNVVRHRLRGGAGELTVKLRKSLGDIINRTEVDLTFGHDTNAGDVEAFLVTAGWERDVVLMKNFTNTFWFKVGNATVTVALYEVERDDGTEARRFLEVEVEKGSKLSEPLARALLQTWSDLVTEQFALNENLKDSLYEIYSGHRYLLAQ